MWIPLLFFAFLPVKKTEKKSEIKYEQLLYKGNDGRTLYNIFPGNKTYLVNNCEKDVESLCCNWKSSKNITSALLRIYNISMNGHLCGAAIEISSEDKQGQNVMMSVNISSIESKSHTPDYDLTTSVANLVLETWNIINTFHSPQTSETGLHLMYYLDVNLLLILYILVHLSLDVFNIKYTGIILLLYSSIGKVTCSSNASSHNVHILPYSTSQAYLKTPVATYNETKKEYSSTICSTQPTFQHLTTNLNPISTVLSAKGDSKCNSIQPSISHHVPVSSTYIIGASFELIRKVRAIRYQAYRDNILSDDMDYMSTALQPYQTSANSHIYYSTQLNTSSLPPLSTSVFLNTTFTPIFLTLEEIARQEFKFLVLAVYYTLENYTMRCIVDNIQRVSIDNGTNGTNSTNGTNVTNSIYHTYGTYVNNLGVDSVPIDNITNGTDGTSDTSDTYEIDVNNITVLWYNITHGEERLDEYGSSILYCLTYGWCSNETIVFGPPITLSSIWDTIVQPVEHFIGALGTEFNISTPFTHFEPGNPIGCPPGYVRYINDSWTDCERKDKYMISLWELWYEFAKPVYFAFDILSSLDVRMLNISINCSLYHNLTELGMNFTEVNKTLTADDYFEIYYNLSYSVLKANYCSNYTRITHVYDNVLNVTLNITAPPCNVTIPDKCYPVRQHNETFEELLLRHELNFTDLEISANCSAYDIFGYDNITFYEIWDEMSIPRDYVLEILTNITSTLKFATVNCSNYDSDLHSNITLSKIWRQFEETKEHIMYLLNLTYFRLPNVTVTCYDYPRNITIAPGIPIPWWDNPLIYMIGGGSLGFILLVLILVNICIYCQKYCGVYVPGSEFEAADKIKWAKEKRKFQRKKMFRNELKRNNWYDPNRRPRRKWKRRKKKSPAQVRKDWILRHMDTMPSIVIENNAVAEQ